MVHSGPHLASMILGYGTYQHADSSAEADVFTTCSHGHPSSHRKDTAEQMRTCVACPASEQVTREAMQHTRGINVILLSCQPALYTPDRLRPPNG